MATCSRPARKGVSTNWRQGLANRIVMNGIAWDRHTITRDRFQGLMAAGASDRFGLAVAGIRAHAFR